MSNEIADPEIKLCRNFRHLSLAQLDTFNADTGLFEIPDQGGDEPAMMKQRKVHARRSYHYKIGQYNTLQYYLNYLSDKMINIPGSHVDTVQNQAQQLSLNPKSDFWLAFKMPLYMVQALEAQLIDREVVKLSHHCWTAALLKIKSELLLMGALAILSGTTSGFRNLQIASSLRSL